MPENITPELSEEKQTSESQKDSLKQLAEQKRKAAAKKRRRRKIVKWSILSVVLLAAAAGIAYGVYKLFFVVEVIPDQTAVSYRGPFSSTVSGYGQVKANKTEAVAVMAKGDLLELYVGEGDTVCRETLFTRSTTPLSGRK
jgi:hypothetical protein